MLRFAKAGHCLGVRAHGCSAERGDREIDRQTGRQTGKQGGRQTGTQAGIQTIWHRLFWAEVT